MNITILHLRGRETVSTAIGGFMQIERRSNTAYRKNLWNIILLLALIFMTYQSLEPMQAQAQARSSGIQATANKNIQHEQSPEKISSTYIAPQRPVLAFYYSWYQSKDWCRCHMPDLPVASYKSADDATIDRQVHQAAHAGISGFVSSWWGVGDQTNSNFGKLLRHAATLEKQTGYHFASSIYFEGDSPHLQGTKDIVNNLRYLLKTYGNSAYFLHWQGKPVLFFWKPLINGRTISTWASIRQQVDPNNQSIWSAEGANINLLNVFDGIHLFSAGYWGLLNGNMNVIDQQFRDRVDYYNSVNHTQKIWAAGVMPGYNDTLVPGRIGTFIVPRNSGETYATSWQAAIDSMPDWITITSFNEWFEGAMIEPGISYGNFYLQMTQRYSHMA
jgi:hypothetical protein